MTHALRRQDWFMTPGSDILQYIIIQCSSFGESSSTTAHLGYICHFQKAHCLGKA
jgi:hypothetical protein